MTNGKADLPVAIVGAGPIGLAAAANLAQRGIAFKVYERGPSVGANLRDWAHVRVFTTWEQSIDRPSRSLLEAAGWKIPAPGSYPTGGEIVRDYLLPLSNLPQLGARIETGARVTSISRLGIDKVHDASRADRPFALRIETQFGAKTELARAVIDATGTWNNPNPMGASGIAAEGERELSDRIAYGMPDILGKDRARYAGKRVAVIGAGYSAATALLDLAALAHETGLGSIVWVTRGEKLAKVYGAGDADGLPARGRMGQALQEKVRSGEIALVQSFAVRKVAAIGSHLTLTAENGSSRPAISGLDEIVVCTGQRPDLDLSRELRLNLDPALECVQALAPLIDPNVHSCGSVPPHGYREVSHAEPDFYTIGAKSYGRAPTFLLMTGYEQARSVVAAIAGDWRAAEMVQLVLPETGVCSGDELPESSGCCEQRASAKQVAASACCGGPAVADEVACCLADEVAKAALGTGCGCQAA